MKKCLVALLIVASLVSCNKKVTADTQVESNNKYESFGAKISDQEALNVTEIAQKYQTMKVGDTLDVKFKSTIKEVCQNKGCWMKLDLGDKKETFVKFKDYAFFMPKDAKNNEVIVNGKAFVSMESVEDQKHYAKDGGMAQAEIDKITTPKPVYSFTADGVLIKK